MILNKKQTKSILDKVLKYSNAESTFVSTFGSDEQLVRYANNIVFTNLSKNEMDINVQVAFGNKKGSSSTNQFDDESLKKCVKRAIKIAKYAPPDPEFMPYLPPQKYKEIDSYIRKTADISPQEKTEIVSQLIHYGIKSKINLYGTLSNQSFFFAISNSNGLYGYHRGTDADFSCTARTMDGTGSYKVAKNNRNIEKINVLNEGKKAIVKAFESKNPQKITPGDYTVVFEPEAVAGLIRFIYMAIDARSADERRSFMSTKDGKTKLGTKVFGNNITIKTIPDHPEILASPFDNSGLPSEETTWIENGVVKNLYYSRYWAKKKGKKPSCISGGLVLNGEKNTVESMIKSVKKGIYVPRLFYLRVVNPMTLQITGLTRDGVYLIENGKLKHPLYNMRFNESLEDILKSIKMLGKPSYVNGSLIPAALVDKFSFTSISKSI